MGNGTLAFVPIDAAMGAAVWPIASARASPDDRILIPLFATVGFLPYLKNTLCSFRRVRLEHWIVIAMDNATCPALARTMGETAGAACIHPYAGSAHFNASAPARYRSKVFNLIVMQRPTWVRWLLARGLSILQCDLDVVFVKDPLPDLRRRPTADMQFQSEQVYGQNGGFYFARPTNASIGLIDRWISRLAERANSKSFEEQHALNHAIKYSRTLRRAGRLNVVKLNDTQYPNGKIWWQLQRSSKADAYVVHCNWVKFNKKTRLVRDNLWFLKEDDSTCDADFDPLAGGCDRWCTPVTYCAPAQPCVKSTCGRIQGEFRRERHRVPWHALAFAAMPGCERPSNRSSKSPE